MSDSSRSDALRNRARLVEVAREAFAESGAASLNTIAKRAGVGPGTLYRHFPTREALVLAVHRPDLQRVVDTVDEVLAAHAPLDALRAWLLALADHVRGRHGLGEALHAAVAQHATGDGPCAPIVTALGVLLDACAAAGQVRPGLDPVDVLLLAGFLWRSADREQARRVLGLAVDGLRP